MKPVLWISEREPLIPEKEMQKFLGERKRIWIGIVDSVTEAHKLINHYLPAFVVSEVPVSTYVMWLALTWWDIPLLIPFVEMEWRDKEGKPPRFKLVGFQRVVDIRWEVEDWKVNK